MPSGRGLFFTAAATVALVAFFVSFKLVTALIPDGETVSDHMFAGDKEAAKYDRSRFGGWLDADGDCLDTRDEILAMASSAEVEFDESGCRVIGGYWVDVYSGAPISDPSSIDIDHLVSLRHAWEGGASSWSDEEMASFANDFENLIITSSSLNRSKKNSSPLEWLPPNDEFQCDFVERFIIVSGEYEITMPPDEEGGLQELKTDLCG
jgi:hypothetical protein